MYDPPTDAQIEGESNRWEYLLRFGLYLTENDVVSADVAGEPVGKRIMNCQRVKRRIATQGRAAMRREGQSFRRFQ